MERQREYPGSHTAAFFAARGVALSPDEACELVRVLLRLADLGALQPCTPGDGAPRSGPGAGRGARQGGVVEGPNAYNMGPSGYIGGRE